MIENRLLRRGYAALPATAQNAVISLFGLRWRYERFGGEFPRLLQSLQRSEWWSADRIQQFENERVARTVRAAYDSVPYYRELLDGCGATPDDVRDTESLARLPLLTKDIVQEQGRRMLAQGVGRLIASETSGSTGKRLRIYKTLHTTRFQWAVWWRHRARFGLRLGDPVLTFGARVPSLTDTGRMPVWRRNAAINQTYLPTFQLTPKTLPAVVEWMNTQSFAFFAGFPTSMAIVAAFMKENGLRLHRRPKVVCSGSETLTPATASLLREQFGAPVTEVYGMGESAGGFAECEAGRLHADFELGRVELLPVSGSADPELRRLVLTGYESPAMPFIRYDVGDYVRVSPGTCVCGRQSLVVESVDGRVQDYLQTPDGRRLYALDHVFRASGLVREGQLVQRALDEVEVRVVPRAGYGPADEEAMKQELAMRAGKTLRIRFTYLDAIPRLDNGKFRQVVSKLPANAADPLQARSAKDA